MEKIDAFTRFLCLDYEIKTKGRRVADSVNSRSIMTGNPFESGDMYRHLALSLIPYSYRDAISASGKISAVNR